MKPRTESSQTHAVIIQAFCRVELDQKTPQAAYDKKVKSRFIANLFTTPSTLDERIEKVAQRWLEEVWHQILKSHHVCVKCPKSRLQEPHSSVNWHRHVPCADPTHVPGV